MLYIYAFQVWNQMKFLYQLKQIFLLFAFTFYGIIRLGNYIIFNFSSMFFLKTKLLDSRFVTQPRRETH